MSRHSHRPLRRRKCPRNLDSILASPASCQNYLYGYSASGVTGKDTIIALCALLKSEVLNMYVEFTGSEQTLASIPISERLTIANMTTEMGSLSGPKPSSTPLPSH
jgi:aconitase A